MKKSFIISFITIICLLVLSSCGNKCDHEYGDYVILENPTCTTSGKKTRTCSICNKSDVTEINVLGHDYDEHWIWTSDYIEATVELVCKNDSTHKIVEVITSRYEETPATCQEMGRKAYIVEVEIEGIVYSDVKSRSISMIEHNFIEGICSMCHYMEGTCDHKDLHDVVIDMKELGCCDSLIAYKTCLCGEEQHPIIDFDLLVAGFTIYNYLIGLNCSDYTYTVEAWQEMDAHNNKFYTKEMCSECGLILEIIANLQTFDCNKYIMENNVCLYKDNELLVEFNFYDEYFRNTHNDYHVTSDDYINLSEYDCCGGAIVVSLCNCCDGFTEIKDIYLNCTKDKPIEQMITSREYEQGGYLCSEDIIYCDKCGLSIITQTMERSGCFGEKIFTLIVKLDDEVIYEESTSAVYNHHDFSEDYRIELMGDTCKDGYKVTIKCDDCDESYYFYKKGHYGFETSNILGNHTCVGNTYYSENCIICDYLIEINSIHIKCSMFKKTITEYIDDENNYHTVETYVCNSCGLTKVIDNYSITKDCVTENYSDETYIINNVEILSFSGNSYRNQQHSYVTDYEMLGTTCEEGIKVTRYCENCDFIESYIDYDHQYYGAEGYHNENICGSKITYSKCMCCDGIFDAYYGNHNWQVISGASDPYENPKTFKCVCEDCGLEFIEVYNYILQPNETCVYKESLKVTLIYDGVEIIKDAIKTYRMANNYPICIHSGTFELIQIGDTGEYIHFRICTVCGKKDVDLLY